MTPDPSSCVKGLAYQTRSVCRCWYIEGGSCGWYTMVLLLTEYCGLHYRIKVKGMLSVIGSCGWVCTTYWPVDLYPCWGNYQKWTLQSCPLYLEFAIWLVTGWMKALWCIILGVYACLYTYAWSECMYVPVQYTSRYDNACMQSTPGPGTRPTYATWHVAEI